MITGLIRGKRSAGIIAGVLILSTSSFGYIRRLTSIVGDTSPAALVRTDVTAIPFLLNANVVAGAQSNASGKAVTVISALSNPVAAVRAALATWNAVSTANVTFLPLQSTNLGIDPNDGSMVIAIGSTPSDLSLVSSALAVTDTYYITSGGVNSAGVNVVRGDITDTDIILNPAIAFSTDGSTSNDLQSVMLHELGHSLGANHTGLLGASMYQYNSNQRFLSTDDLAFVNSAYPATQGSAALGTISGLVTAAGAPVPYALLEAFDTSQGITVGGIAGTDGTYSFQVPPGNYQIYAEPLTTGLVPIILYLTSDQLTLATSVKFQTTLYNGTLALTANGTASANIAVTPGSSALTAPFLSASPVNGTPGSFYSAIGVTVPSGGSTDLVFAGTGFDGTLSNANFTIYGKGITLQPGSVRVDKSFTVGGFNLLRATVNVAATTTQSMATLVVTSGANTLSFSGAILIVPPTPTFVSAGVISAAAYVGIQGGVSPGGIYSIYSINGSPNLGPGGSDPTKYITNAPSYDAYGNIPTILGGVSVTFDGVPAPMFLSWGYQLNFQVPYEVAGKTSTKVVVNYLGSASAAVSVPVLAVQPLFFTSDGKAVRALNLPSYIPNDAQHPAPKGSYVEVYGTGAGKLSNTLVTGHGSGVPSFAGSYTYSIGGSPAAPAYFGGLTSGSVGLAQWDLLIPSTSLSGAVSVVVTDASGTSSQPGATIFVQ